MDNRSFNHVAGTVVPIAHLYRAAQALSIQIGSMALPQWVSWIGTDDVIPS